MRSGQAVVVGVCGPEGKAFLDELDSLYSTATKSPRSEPEALKYVPLAGIVDIPECSTKLSPKIIISHTPESPEGITIVHGFRRLSLPHQDESRLVFRTNLHGSAAEHFRLLRRTLCEKFDKGALLIITSPGVADGKTLTALNLSACLAESGEPTLLVESNFRRPTIGNVLGCAIEAPGIEDAFAGRVGPNQVVNFIGELSLHVAVVTRTSDDSSPSIKRVGSGRFLAWAREHFRWVVLDAGPVLPDADVAESLPFESAVLLVIRARHTSVELSRRAFEVLGKRLHGVIFNEATIS